METVNNGLALPVAGMLALTMLVWLFLFFQRMRYIAANNIDAEDLKAPVQVQALIPPEHSSGSNNFKNLLEVPVIFYAVSLYLTVFGQVDELHVACAWAFLVLRVVHSLIHCSYNRVMHRFLAYLLSSIAVWVMVVRALLAAL